jgi:TolA-binding protein
MAWAWQNMGQYDNACSAYLQVAQGTAAEVAARAQLQIGLCRLAQKRLPDALKELLAVAFVYDYPQHSSAALCEAGQVQVELKQPAEAARLWQSVIHDYPSSKSAETAKQRLATLK